MRILVASGVVAVVFAASFAAISCGSSSAGNAPDGASSEGGVTGFGNVEGGNATCQGIGCNTVACGSAPVTTITGQVLDPAGKNPVYNVIVYIPTNATAQLPPLAATGTCDSCNATPINLVTSALTDENGKFTLSNVPVMAGVPVVVQLGKWRLKTTIDVTSKCAENKFAAPISLPSKGSQGDMPQIAVTTGEADSLECLLLGIGIDQGEFVYGAGGTGHVHMFAGYDGFNANSAIPTAQDNLWQDQGKMSAYDILALSCEGGEHPENKNNRQPMHQYIQGGGRVFATHYHYVWFKDSPENDFQSIATWGGTYETDGDYTVDQTFTKGQSFAKWLVDVDASTTLGSLPLTNVTASVAGVSTNAQSWIAHDVNNVKYFSFNAPVGGQTECGRVVFGDLHVSGTGETSFPSACTPQPGQALTPQQKALEFLFWDLSSCVQSDSEPPQPPK